MPNNTYLVGSHYSFSTMKTLNDNTTLKNKMKMEIIFLKIETSLH